jgi:hypothetical protein
MAAIDLAGLMGAAPGRSGTWSLTDVSAARLALFLAYVRDNALSLGLDGALVEGPLDATHAANVAARVAMALGMDGNAFCEYASSIAPADMARTLASGGIEPGTLALTGDPEADGRVPRALDLLEDIGQDERHQTFLPESELVAGVLLACGPAAGSARRLCDPMCGHGGLLVRLHRTAGGAWPKVAATDVDAASVAITSIRLLAEGYRGGFENVRQADSLSSDDSLGGMFDVVACEARYAARRRDMRSAVDPRFLSEMTGRSWAKVDVEGLALLRVAGLLAEGGTAVVLTTTVDTYALAQAGLRQYLVEGGLVEACVEVPRRLPSSRQTGLTMWVLSRGGKGGEGVLLVVLDGDGLERERLDLYAPGSPIRESARWLGRLVSNRREVPFMSMVVPKDVILAAPGSSLRFSGYAGSIDVAGRLGRGLTAGEIAVRRRAALAELASAEDELSRACREIWCK